MSPLIPIDALGWAAAALTLASFVSRDMLRLRLLALAANMAFICYGLGAGLWPVASLHMLLVPVNLRRLLELRQKPHALLRRGWVRRYRQAPRAAPGRRRSDALRQAGDEAVLE